MASGHGRLGWYLVWAVVFCDIGTSVYYTPGILYHSTKDLAGVFVVLTLVAFLLLCSKEVEVARRFVEGGGVVTVASHAFSPGWGCLGGQLIIVDYLLTAAISATSGVYYIDSVLGSTLTTHSLIVPVTIIFLIFFGILNTIGIRESATVSAVLATAALVVDLIVIAVVLITNTPTVVAHIFQEFAKLGTLPVKTALIGYAGAWLAFSGLESLSQISPAMRDNYRTPLWGMVFVAGTVIITSPFLTFFSTALLPPEIKVAQSERFISELGFITGGWALQAAVVMTASALLLFAANTAVIGNYHVQLTLARMGFLPRWFSNRSFRFGTPHWAIFFSVGVPALIVRCVGGNMTLLGDMYAFGLLGSFTLKSIGLDWIRWQEGRRGLGFWLGILSSVMVSVAFVVNLICKPKATIFGGLVSGLGLLVALATKKGWWEDFARRIPGLAEPIAATGLHDMPGQHLSCVLTQHWPGHRILVAVRGLNVKVLKEARLQALSLDQTHVHLMYVDETMGLFFSDLAIPSPEGLTVLEASRDHLKQIGIEANMIWDLSHSAAESIAEAARGLDVATVIIGPTRRGRLLGLLRGRFIRKLMAELPPEIRLLVVE